MKNNRRSFIKKSVAGFAGITIIPSVIRDNKYFIKPELKEKFIYRTLGNTGIKLPVISMGVMNADNPALVKAALDEGIVHLDTAWYYQRGRNEEMIGEVIKDRPRDTFVIGTKVWEPRDNNTGLFPKEASADTFIQKFETSLKRLHLDYVDILYLHNIFRKESVLFEPYLNAMINLKKQGKTRFIGVSTHMNEVDVINTAVESKVYDVILTSYNFKQKNLKEIEEAIEMAAKAGIGIVGMKAIAGSVYNIGREVKVNAKAALKWAMRNENIHTNIPGFTTFDQMNTALSVMENLELTPEEEADLEKNKTMAGLFCQQCRECLPQCPEGINIPSFMRSYMYAYGYRNLIAAKETLDYEDLSDLACNNCGSCKVNCNSGFDIKNKILDISRIKNVPEDFLV